MTRRRKKDIAARIIQEIPASVFEEAAEGAAQQCAQELLEKHDYRQVNVGNNVTVTIDLERLKKEAIENIYKELGCPGLSYGA